jgi:hypothetical protein
MRISELEKTALQLLIDGDPDHDILNEQIDRATVRSRQYTGVGFYTVFDVAADARRVESARWKIEDMPQTHAEHPSLTAGAGFILWLKDGLINTLEGYTYEGDWPEDESKFKITKAQQGVPPDRR